MSQDPQRATVDMPILIIAQDQSGLSNRMIESGS